MYFILIYCSKIIMFQGLILEASDIVFGDINLFEHTRLLKMWVCVIKHGCCSYLCIIQLTL
jgi:hypothetical protein